jgi:hypothetical protein
MDSVTHRDREEVKAKQLEALKKLGHSRLKLDEYESLLDSLIGSAQASEN